MNLFNEACGGHGWQALPSSTGLPTHLCWAFLLPVPTPATRSPQTSASFTLSPPSVLVHRLLSTDSNPHPGLELPCLTSQSTARSDTPLFSCLCVHPSPDSKNISATRARTFVVSLLLLFSAYGTVPGREHRLNILLKRWT